VTEYNANQVKGMVLIRDGAQMIVDGVQKILETTEPKETEKPTQNELDSLKSTEQTSSKGPYQLVTKAENSNNPVFEKLQSYLKEKGDFVILHGYKTWKFSNNPDKIGIRKK